MADKKELPLALLEILKQYTDEEHMLNTTNIIKLLNSKYSLDCERRTIYANMELLKRYGYKISTWQENGQGYYLKSHQFSLDEISVLCNLLENSDMPEKEQRRLKKKLLSTLSDAQKKKYAQK